MATNRVNRNFTTTEEADLSCASYNNVFIEVMEDCAIFRHAGSVTEDVFIFATGDNEYVVHQSSSCHVVITDELKDAMDTAAEIIYTS